jgi:hypothetical protein
MPAPPAVSRDNIMNAIADQALNVRRTFEADPSKRKRTVSSATAAAAEHMASLNRKRKLENHLALRAQAASTASPAIALPSPAFNPVSRFNRPGKVRVVSTDSSNGNASTPIRRPRVSGGLTLKSSQQDIMVTNNDVVCGKGKTTTSLVGNQRYKVWVDLHKDAFAKAPNEEDRRRVACSVVNAVSSSLPEGRFLSLDIHSGYWYDVGYDRAVGITMETLMVESGMMWNMNMATRPVARPTKNASPRVFASKAA